MPASDIQEARFRAYFTDSAEAIFTDPEIDDIFDEAAEIADSSNSSVIMVEARIIGTDRIMMDAAKQVSYKQNSHSVNMSDVFKALEKMRGLLEKERDRLVTLAAGSAVRMGVPVKVPKRRKDCP